MLSRERSAAAGGERSASFGTFVSGAKLHTLDFGALAPKPAWGRVGPPFPVGEREGTTENRSPGSCTSPSDSCSKSRTLFTHASVLQQPSVFSSRVYNQIRVIYCTMLVMIHIATVDPHRQSSPLTTTSTPPADNHPHVYTRVRVWTMKDKTARQPRSSRAAAQRVWTWSL